MIREHRGALEYDLSQRFPTRCPQGLRSVDGDTITLSEMARLVAILRADPSSAVAAAVEGWAHPVSREAAILMDLFDLQAAKTGAKKPPKYVRPWATDRTVEQVGDAAGRTREQVEDILARARRGELRLVPKSDLPAQALAEPDADLPA